MFVRAQLAFEEGRALTTQCRALQAEYVRDREELRVWVIESAMYRSETKAHRENREERYRDRAQEFRTKADLMVDADLRAQYGRLVEAYEQLVARNTDGAAK